MKNNPALKGLLISVAAVLIAFGIYFFFLAKKNEFLVDNPTANTYYFKINNGAEKIISAGQYVKVDLQKGRNSVKVFDDKKSLLYDSSFTVNKVRGLLNIAHQDYYINTQYYGYDLKKDSLLLALDKTMIDGKLHLGAPKHFNRLYTDDFYYNVDEDYDKVVKNIQKTESRTKIFRKQDFLNYYKEYYKF
ncbi:MAG: hypothetical protein K0M56_01925 [Kaistella sp.]|nr:hypothetical protein [Kaistella sp.]